MLLSNLIPEFSSAAARQKHDAWTGPKVVSGYAKVIYASTLGFLCVLYTESAFVCARCATFSTVCFNNSAQLLNIYPAVEAEAYCESPFSLLQEEVFTLHHFTFHTCNWKRDHDGSWAFSNLKHFECTSFVITLLYRLKTFKPQTPYKHSFPTPKFYKIAEINFNQ